MSTNTAHEVVKPSWSRGSIISGLIVLALVGGLATMALLYGGNDAPPPAPGATEITVPRMQNVPPPDKKIDLEVDKD